MAVTKKCEVFFNLPKKGEVVFHLQKKSEFVFQLELNCLQKNKKSLFDTPTGGQSQRLYAQVAEAICTELQRLYVKLADAICSN